MQMKMPDTYTMVPYPKVIQNNFAVHRIDIFISMLIDWLTPLLWPDNGKALHPVTVDRNALLIFT